MKIAIWYKGKWVLCNLTMEQLDRVNEAIKGEILEAKSKKSVFDFVK